MPAFRKLFTVAVLAAMLPLPSLVQAQPHSGWTRSWQAVPSEPPPSQAATAPQPGSPPTPRVDATYHMIARLSAGGTALRLRLSNEMTPVTQPISAVHIALAGPDGRALPGSDRIVTFDGNAAPVIPAGAPLVSDPVPLKVAPLARILVSIHVPGGSAPLTVHPAGFATTRIVPSGQITELQSAPGGTTSTMRFLLTGIDVTGGLAAGTIVTVGDSITDGAKSTVDANRRWPDILAERLHKAGRYFAVANAGIGGNRLLDAGTGPAALARFDRDALSVPGVRYIVVLEGINDIGRATRTKTALPRVEDIASAYRQMITRAHDRGVKVIGATIAPYKGAGYYSTEGDAVRLAVNNWIRKPGNFDGVIDFDQAIADKADPLRIAPAYDSGDALHPNDAGYKAMGDAIDLSLFR